MCIIFTYIGNKINTICLGEPVLCDTGIPSHISDLVFAQQNNILLHSPANVKSIILNQNLLNTSYNDRFNYGNFNLYINITTWLEDHKTQKGWMGWKLQSHLSGAICYEYFTKGNHNLYFIAENSDT